MAMSQHLRIGQLASMLGLNAKTIRYYESVRVLPTPQRTPAGYRVYGTADISRLKFILKAKRIGLTLEEIREILTLQKEGQQPCAHVLELADRKVAAIDEKLRALQELRHELTSLRLDAGKLLQQEGTVCNLIEEHAMQNT
jgi:DNA-binding transcriptional MerR regulator